MRKVIILILTIVISAGLSCSKTPSREVVLYNTLDEVFSGPILQDFEKATGIKVKMLTDTETSKTVGVVMRLVEEKDHPQADVLWNSEIGWMFILKEKDILTPYIAQSANDIPEHYKDPEGFWTGFAARARVFLYNTNLLKDEEAPKSMFDLTKPMYKGKVAISRPVLGSGATHAAAMFAKLGEVKAIKYYLDLKANDCKVLPGPLIAAKMVANGEAAVCLVDSDDANEMLLDKKPVKMLYPDQDGMGTFIFPNTVALIKGGPNPDNGKKLIEYLLSAETEQKLAKIPSAQMPVRDNLEPYSLLFDRRKIKAMEIDYKEMAKWLEPIKKIMYDEFLK